MSLTTAVFITSKLPFLYLTSLIFVLDLYKLPLTLPPSKIQRSSMQTVLSIPVKLLPSVFLQIGFFRNQDTHPPSMAADTNWE